MSWSHSAESKEMPQTQSGIHCKKKRFSSALSVTKPLLRSNWETRLHTRLTVSSLFHTPSSLPHVLLMPHAASVSHDLSATCLSILLPSCGGLITVIQVLPHSYSNESSTNWSVNGSIPFQTEPFSHCVLGRDTDLWMQMWSRGVDWQPYFCPGQLYGYRCNLPPPVWNCGVNE